MTVQLPRYDQERILWEAEIDCKSPWLQSSMLSQNVCIVTSTCAYKRSLWTYITNSLKFLRRDISRSEIEIIFHVAILTIWRSGPRNYAGLDICFAGSIHSVVSTLFQKATLPLASFQFATTLVLGISDRKVPRMLAFRLAILSMFVTHRHFTVTHDAAYARGKTNADCQSFPAPHDILRYILNTEFEYQIINIAMFKIIIILIVSFLEYTVQFFVPEEIFFLRQNCVCHNF